MSNDQTGQPVPRHQLPPGATCILTADGSPPDAIELAQIEQFRQFLKLAKDTDKASAYEAVYGEPYLQDRGVR